MISLMKKFSVCNKRVGDQLSTVDYGRLSQNLATEPVGMAVYFPLGWLLAAVWECILVSCVNNDANVKMG